MAKVVFSDGTGYKKRPALIISRDKYNKNRNEIIIAAVTSNTDRKLYGDTGIRQWEQAGLLFPSQVTGIVQTLHKNMIERKLGTLSETDFQAVKKNLKISISI